MAEEGKFHENRLIQKEMTRESTRVHHVLAAMYLVRLLSWLFSVKKKKKM